MFVLGLTGNIGCGKSTVTDMLRELGAAVVDADEIAREIVLPGMDAWRELVEEFGRGILNEDGSINRSNLASLAFAGSKTASRLDEITHTRIIERMKARLDDLRASSRDGVVVMVAPLLFETGALDLVDRVLLVTADREKCVSRLVASRRISREDAERRMQRQASQESKMAKADFIIDNNGTLEQTREQVRELWQRIAAGRRG